MELIDFINKVAKNVFIFIFTYIVFIKVTNYKNNDFRKFILMIFISYIEAVICVILFQKVSILMIILVVYTFHSLVISKITENKIQYSIIVTFISLTIAYLLYGISILIGGFFIKLIIPDIKESNPIILLAVVIIENIILYIFFKIKRFSNGISFLKNQEKVNDIGIIGIAFIGIAILFFSLFDLSRGIKFTTYLTTGIFIEAICLTIWIRRKITKYYKQNLKNNTIKELEDEIKVKNAEINRILEENKAIATINHKYSSRIRALENISSKILTKPEIIEVMKVEFGDEFINFENQIKRLSEEYSKEIEEKIKHENKLMKIGNFGIDNILEYMKEEAEKNNIKCNLKISANINYMIEKIIDQSKLETLLCDHIKDAIIAINYSENTYKSILITIGIIDNCYEIRIYDTGIEFEIDTLLKLGIETITTHKESGGSGIGFMTTFETLKETKASLIIKEIQPVNNTNYTKYIAIRFDGKNEYIIKSYRAEKIKKRVKDNRIIIK